MRVSVLILTYNEELNIERCLSSLQWCDDILVIDSGSSDRTVKIAESLGAHVLFRSFDDFASQRNYGLESYEFKNDWVLHLDADEVLTDRFIGELGILEAPSNIFAFQIPSKTMLFGKWIKHAGMWPTYQVRLGHKDRLRFIQVGHGQREDLPDENVGTFEEPYEHFSFSHGLERWLIKHVGYARDEANLLLEYRGQNRDSKKSHMRSGTAKRRMKKQRSAGIPFFLRPAARFFYVYLLRGGFRDGLRGFVYAFMLSVYEGMTAVLAYEIMLSRDESLHPKIQN